MTEDDFDAVLDLGKGLISSEELQSWGRGGALEFSFIADVDSHMVGFNLAYVEFFGIPISKLCVISGIVVEEEYHRLGIGYRLVEGVFKACKEQNVDPTDGKAMGQLAKDNAEARFLNGKVLTAKFYCANELPQVRAKAAAITSNDMSALRYIWDEEVA